MRLPVTSVLNFHRDHEAINTSTMWPLGVKFVTVFDLKLKSSSTGFSHMSTGLLQLSLSLSPTADSWTTSTCPECRR